MKIYRKASLKAQHVEPANRWATVADNHARCYSQITRKCGCKNWTIEDWKKSLPSLTISAATFK